MRNLFTFYFLSTLLIILIMQLLFAVNGRHRLPPSPSWSLLPGLCFVLEVLGLVYQKSVRKF